MAAMTTADGQITGRMLIGGAFVESESERWLETINPANEEVIGRVPEGSAADMGAAVEAALAAQPAWAALDMQVRADYLNRLGDAIMTRADEIARLETLDTGNTIGKMKADVEKSVERIPACHGAGLRD